MTGVSDDVLLFRSILFDRFCGFDWGLLTSKVSCKAHGDRINEKHLYNNHDSNNNNLNIIIISNNIKIITITSLER